jgi:sulfoxide reductase heme-binding subunit YedZ
MAWMIYDYFTSRLTFNPIQAATQRTGQTAIVLLLLTLSITPISTYMHLRSITVLRRPLGLYAFLYAALHLIIYAGLDYGFDWMSLYLSVLEKPFIIAGLTALIILVALALTSFKMWMRIMGKNWKRLHRLVYLAGIIVILHYAWVKKGNLFTLQGDITLPFIAFILYLGLMVARLPALRRLAVEQRRPFLAVSPQTKKG